MGNEKAIKCKTKKIVDPLKTSLAVPGAEGSLPVSFAAPPAASNGRPDLLPPYMWDKLDATPYGRFEKMMQSTPADAKAMQPKIQFDHYGISRGRLELDKEFPKGKKAFRKVR